MRLQEANKAAEQDRARAEAEDADRNYDGYRVLRIRKDQVVFDGEKAPFRPAGTRFADRIELGDLIPKGLGDDRHYWQVIDNDDRDSGRVKVRLITDRSDSNGLILNVTLPKYAPIRGVLEPTENQIKDYVKAPPAPKVVPFAENGIPNVRNDYAPRAAEMEKKYNEGFQQVGRNIAQGAINLGAGYYKIGADQETEIFRKKVKKDDNNREYYNEIIASKMFNALGLNEVVVVGLPDKQTLIQDKVSGNMADFKLREQAEIQRNPQNYPNYRLIGLVDYLMVNTDRHGENWFINAQGQPVPIDHGYTWFGSRPGASPHPAFAKKALGRLALGDVRGVRVNDEPMFTKAELQGMKQSIANLREDFLIDGNRHGSAWYQYVMLRFDTLINRYDR